ncbi:MAG: universal stress protein [Gammaproteobacteria bacterium]|nr:universal stress protein [Gammaproteobacteria bacterium]
MYKKIMVAVDGSDAAKRALMEAENIAKTYDAALCIVHSINLSVGVDIEAERKAGAEILEQAKTLVNTSNTETRNLQAKTEFGLNGVVEAVAAAVVDWKADLLVVGTANRRGLERFFVGSVAEQLITKVNSSILLVRPPKS